MTGADAHADVASSEHYAALYSQIEREAEWLVTGAVGKVDSIQLLLERRAVAPESVLELGCGTGAVIAECRRRGIGRRHVAIDFAQPAIDYLRAHSEGIEAWVADITDPAFRVRAEHDVVIASHVLEHLRDPAAFLSSLRDRVAFRFAVLEVPLEDLLASRLKWAGRDRTNNSAGHLQFFRVRSFNRLLSSVGMKVLDDRLYAPVLDLDTVRLVCRKNGIVGATRAIKPLTAHYLPRWFAPVWRRFYYAHYAVLCVKR